MIKDPLRFFLLNPDILSDTHLNTVNISNHINVVVNGSSEGNYVDDDTDLF